MPQNQVLIAGGGGIGYETAQACARRGANVVLTDVNADTLKQAVAYVPPLGVDCRIRTIDVGDEVAMQRLAEELKTAVGTIDVLVSNAGIPFVGRFVKMPMWVST